MKYFGIYRILVEAQGFGINLKTNEVFCSDNSFESKPYGRIKAGEYSFIARDELETFQFLRIELLGLYPDPSCATLDWIINVVVDLRY